MIFISYSHEQDELARVALRDLEERGVECWYAPRNVAPGADWGAEIVNAIRRCRAVLVIISSSAVESSHVKNELLVAIDVKVPIYWLKLSDEFPDALRYQLTNSHGIDWDDHEELPAAMTEALVAADQRVAPEGMAALKRTPWVIGVGVAMWWTMLYSLLVLFTQIFAGTGEYIHQGGGVPELAGWAALFGLITVVVCIERAANGTRLVDPGGAVKVAMIGHVVGALIATVWFTIKGSPGPGDWWIGPAFAAAFATLWVHRLAVRLDA